jgi:hypothetical protein
MDSTVSQILQFSDLVSTRKCALRIAPEDASLALGALLEKYLKHAPIQRLLGESRITPQSAGTLYAIQDLVYTSDDSGQLGEMFTGIVFKEPGGILGSDDVPTAHLTEVDDQQVSIIDIAIDRIDAGYDRNWTGFHRRKWARDPEKYSDFVLASLERELGPEQAGAALQMDTTKGKLKLIKALGRTLWHSRFENYSRFTGKRLVYKSGDETIDNIIDGGGAVCSEKVQALKFLTDHYGLTSEYIIAGENAGGPVPVDKLRELLTTFDFRFSKRYMRYWQHTALLYDVDGVRVLVDATNGNIPFMFLQDDAAGRILDQRDKAPVTVKMVESEEDFFYHIVPQDIPENLFFALEGWWSFSDLMQVFENELGLYLSSEFYVTPIAFKSDKEFRRDSQEYLEVSKRAGLAASVTADWTLDSPLGAEFSEAEPQVSEKILQARDHLISRLDECDGPGHRSGLVIMKLQNRSAASSPA